jgi:hypothetical protein
MQRNTWTKSSRSGNNGACVEVMNTGDAVRIRDTKDNGNGPVLSFTAQEWTAFIAAAKNGEFENS